MEKRVEICNFGKPMVTCRARNDVVEFLVDPTTDVEHERRVINTMMAIYTALEDAPTPEVDVPVPAPGIHLPQRSRYRVALAGALAATTVGAVLTLTLTGGTELADPRHSGGAQASHAAGHGLGSEPSITPVATTAETEPTASGNHTPAPRTQSGSGRLHVFTPKPTTPASPQEQPQPPTTDLVSADSGRDCSILCQVAEMLTTGHA